MNNWQPPGGVAAAAGGGGGGGDYAYNGDDVAGKKKYCGGELCNPVLQVVASPTHSHTLTLTHTHTHSHKNITLTHALTADSTTT